MFTKTKYAPCTSIHYVNKILQNLYSLHSFVTVFSRFRLMKTHSAIVKYNRKHLASAKRSSCFYYRSQEQDIESHLISVFVNVVLSAQMPYLHLRAEACRLIGPGVCTQLFCQQLGDKQSFPTRRRSIVKQTQNGQISQPTDGIKESVIKKCNYA